MVHKCGLVEEELGEFIANLGNSKVLGYLLPPNHSGNETTFNMDIRVDMKQAGRLDPLKSSGFVLLFVHIRKGGPK